MVFGFGFKEKCLPAGLAVWLVFCLFPSQAWGVVSERDASEAIVMQSAVGGENPDEEEELASDGGALPADESLVFAPPDGITEDTSSLAQMPSEDADASLVDDLEAESPEGVFEDRDTLDPRNTAESIDAAMLATETYSIAASQEPSMVLDVEAAGMENGAPVKLWRANGHINETFFLSASGEDGSYVIRAAHSSKVLAVAGLNAQRGAAVVQWEDNDTDNMRWYLDGDAQSGFTIVSKDTGLVLDYAADSVVPGADMVVWEATGAAKQTFLLRIQPNEVEPDSKLTERTVADGIYSLSCFAASSNVIGISDSSLLNGASAQLEGNGKYLSQKFQVSFYAVEGDRGYYSIRALSSGKVLAVAGFDAQNGTQVMQWQDNATDNMRWSIRGDSSEGFEVVSVDTGLLLDYASNNAAPGTSLVVWERTGALKQRFSFTQEKVVEDGFYEIALRSLNDLLVSVNLSSQEEGMNVVLDSSWGGLSQKFHIGANDDGTYQIKACHSGKVLEFSPGGKIVQSSPSDSGSQKWTISPDAYGGFSISTVSKNGSWVGFWTGGNNYVGASVWGQQIPPANEDQSFLVREACLIDDGLYTVNTVSDTSLAVSMSSNSAMSGETTQLAPTGANARQIFSIANHSAQTVSITSWLSGKVLGVFEGSGMGSSVCQMNDTGASNTRWLLLPTYSGGVYVRNASNGLALDYASDILSAGAAMVVWEPHGHAKQQFVFTATTAPEFKVFIDAGHGWNSSAYGSFDPGAIGIYTENNLTNELTTLLASRCGSRGIAVVTNAYATEETGVPYRLRQSYAASLGCSTFLSIHFNAGGGSGAESYIHTTNAAAGSATFQSIMHPCLVQGTGLRDRGMGKMSLAVCSGDLPAVLLEVGFIDNVYDMDQYQNRKALIASFLAKGLEDASNTSECYAS